MSTPTERTATLNDLSRVDGKTELVAGRIIHLTPAGRRPNRIAARILLSLDDHAETALAAKRAGHFEASTLAAWGVDPVRNLIRSNLPAHPTTFLPGQIARAELAVPGRQMQADRVFG